MKELFRLRFLLHSLNYNAPTPTPELSDSTTSGVFTITDTIQIVDDSLLKPIGTGGSVAFMDIAAWQHVLVTSVSLNGKNLSISPDAPLHYIFTAQKSFPAVWNVKGNSTIPDIDYSHAVGMPVYNGYEQLPQSIDHLKEVSIVLTRIANATDASVEFRGEKIDGLTKASTSGIQNINSSTVSLKVTPSFVDPTTNGEMRIHLTNYSWKIFSGKNFLFINEIIFVKKISIR